VKSYSDEKKPGNKEQMPYQESQKGSEEGIHVLVGRLYSGARSSQAKIIFTLNLIGNRKSACPEPSGRKKRHLAQKNIHGGNN